MKFFINDKEYQQKEFAATLLNLRLAQHAEDDLSLTLLRSWVENTVSESQKAAIYNTMANFEFSRIFDRANHHTIAGVHFRIEREQTKEGDKK